METGLSQVESNTGALSTLAWDRHIPTHMQTQCIHIHKGGKSPIYPVPISTCNTQNYKSLGRSKSKLPKRMSPYLRQLRQPLPKEPAVSAGEHTDTGKPWAWLLQPLRRTGVKTQHQMIYHAQQLTGKDNPLSSDKLMNRISIYKQDKRGGTHL